MAAAPIFVGSTQTTGSTVSAANTNRDGTGTIVDILTSGASGSVLYKIVAKATSTTTAGMLRIYLKKSATYYLMAELPVSAVTPSGSVESYRGELNFPPDNPLPLEAGDIIGVSTHVAETFKVTAFYGDF